MNAEGGGRRGGKAGGGAEERPIVVEWEMGASVRMRGVCESGW